MSKATRPRRPGGLLDYEKTEAYCGGVSRSTIKLLAAQGRIKRVKIGRRTLFVQQSLDDYIASL
jgi:excisionase family DNA binding protein